jgi:hypothetical protein
MWRVIHGDHGVCKLLRRGLAVFCIMRICFEDIKMANVCRHVSVRVFFFPEELGNFVYRLGVALPGVLFSK